MKTTLTIHSLLFFCFSIQISAQESINSSSINLSESTGSITSSIGQTFFETSSSSVGNISTGVQHSYDITETLGSDITEINLNLKIYPIPTQDVLHLKIGFNDHKKYRYDLFDGSGKILTSRSINEFETAITMSSYPAAIYYLKISKDGKVVKTFKVLKTDK